jgi:hypothetical protein
MAGLVNLFITTKRYVRHNRSRIQAAKLMKFYLDPLQMHVRQDTWDQASNDLRLGTRSGSQEFLDNITFTPNYEVTGLLNDCLRRVKLSITWTEPAP